MIKSKWSALLLVISIVSSIESFQYYAHKRGCIETVIFGDSLSSEDPNDYGVPARLPSWRQLLYQQFSKQNYISAGNFAHAGHTTLDQLPFIEAYEPSSACKGNIAILWLGINDLGQGASVAQLKAQLKREVSILRAKNVSVVATTLTAYDANFYKTESTVDTVNARRLRFNNWLRSEHKAIGAPVLVDLASYPQIGAVGAGADTTYFKDKLHMALRGRRLVATLFGKGVRLLARGSAGVITYK